MEIKILTEEDYLQSMKLSMYAFQYQVPEEDIPKRLEKLKNQRLLGIFEGDELAAKLHILSLNVNVGKVNWKMGGIAGVATYPEHRRKGYVNALIKRALEDLRNDGKIVSFLHPFKIDFYRKFGWEIISDHKKVQIEKKDLKFIGKPSGSILRCTKDGHSVEIEEIYQEFAERHSGMLARDRSWWLDSIYGTQTAAVYSNAETNARGYLLYEVKDNVMKIEEYVALDHEARIGLWNFICQHDSMVERVEMVLSAHDPFPYFLAEPKVKTEITPYFMGRIVNAGEALKSYPFIQTGAKIFLHLSDEFAPWNAGTYQLSQGEVSVYPAKEGSSCVQQPKRGLQLDVNALSAMLFGYMRPLELYSLEQIKGDYGEVVELEKMIPPLKPFFYDFF